MKRPLRLGTILRQFGLNAGGIAIIAVLIFPIYWMIVLALEESRSILARTPVLWPEHPTTANFGRAWDLVASNIATSVVISVATVVVVLIISLPGAYALAHFRFRWSIVVMFALLLAQMIPGISLSLSYYTIFSEVGLLNSHFGLILGDSTYGVPFCVVLLRAFMATIPADTLAAARIDGAGEWRVFFSMVIPLALPGIVTSALFAFLFAWGDFLFSVTLNAAGKVRPLTLGLYQFVGLYASDWGGIMAALAIALVPASMFLIFAQRYLTAGVRTGGLSG